MTYELTRVVGSVYMRQVCDITAVDGGESVRQGGRLFYLSSSLVVATSHLNNILTLGDYFGGRT